MPNGNERESYRTCKCLWPHTPQQQAKAPLLKPAPADVAHSADDQDFYSEQQSAKKANNGARQGFKSKRKTGEYGQHTQNLSLSALSTHPAQPHIQQVGRAIKPVNAKTAAAKRLPSRKTTRAKANNAPQTTSPIPASFATIPKAFPFPTDYNIRWSAARSHLPHAWPHVRITARRISSSSALLTAQRREWNDDTTRASALFSPLHSVPTTRVPAVSYSRVPAA